MPLTWDHSSPAVAPSSSSSSQFPAASSSGHLPIASPEITGGGQTFEPADFDTGGVRTIHPAVVYDLDPRFTGRTRALGQLLELTRKAFDDRELGFAIVIGDHGMGRRRLINELLTQIRAEHPMTRLFQGAADENAHAYGPVARALTTRFGLVIGEDPTISRDRLTTELAEVVDPDRLTEVSHLLAHLLRVPFEDSPIVTPIAGSPQRLEARLFMALKRFLAAESERYPLLIVIEHLELCGADTINFLRYLAAGLGDHRVVIIGTATAAVTERHPAFGDGDIAPVRIEIGALTPSEAEELLRELCKQVDRVPDALIAHVRAMAASPRTICELVRLLLEIGCIVRAGQGWRLDDDALAGFALPTTYDELVGARLAALPAIDRRVLEMAAVVGDTSWLDAILALERHGHVGGDPDGPTLGQIAGASDRTRPTVVAAVARLVEHGWLIDVPQSSIAGEHELRFASAMLWQLVYAAVAEPTRCGYHAVVARWLELHPEGQSPAAQEEVGRHLALAGAGRDAALRYRRAAAAARLGFANQRAIALYDRALECIGGHDLGTRIELWQELAQVYELIGDFEAALAAFERMLRLSWVAASKTTAGMAFNKMGRVWRRKGDLKLALEYLQRGLELYAGASDARGVASSLDDIGRALHMLGRYDEAEAKITDALARHVKAGDDKAIATSLSRLGNVRQDRGQYDSAYQCHREALEIRAASGDRWGQVVARNNLAALAFELGDLGEARAGWLAALPEAEAIGALPLSALVLTNLGELALAEYKLDEARSRLENALEIIEEIQDRGLESVCCRHLAALEKARANPVAARDLAERALEVAQRAGLREHEAQAYMTLGDVLSVSPHQDHGHGGGHDDATDADVPPPAALAFSAAIDVLTSIGNEAVLAKALFVFGRYKAARGEYADGKDMMRDALMMFSRLGLERPTSEVERALASMN